MKVALVHDSITQFGGAERVLQSLHRIYPDAPVFTLIYDQKLAEHFEDWVIVSSPLQFLYNFIPRFQWMLPLIPWALKQFDFSKFDLVISSSSVFVKNITVPENVLHIDYCHTPARFLWLESESYVHEEVPAILRPIVKSILSWLRKWDHQGAQRVDVFLANSKNVQDRIKKYYQRDSEILYPSIDTEFFHPTIPKEDYYLIAGRLQAHKRNDLVIKAFNDTPRRLHVVGTGRALEKLKEMAGDNIEFFGQVEDKILRDQYSGALGYIFPQEEDFGLMPIEAMACGTSVIAYGKGGALETVIENKTGVFFREHSVQSLKAGLVDFENTQFFGEDLFDQADQFSFAQFSQNLQNYVNDAYENRNRS